VFGFTFSIISACSSAKSIWSIRDNPKDLKNGKPLNCYAFINIIRVFIKASIFLIKF
jgi:hypothetical protein